MKIGHFGAFGSFTGFQVFQGFGKRSGAAKVGNTSSITLFFCHFWVTFLTLVTFTSFLAWPIGGFGKYTFSEWVMVRQENMTATWGSTRSTLFKFLAFGEIILVNLLCGVLFQDDERGGLSLRGGSCHDRNRHNRHNRRNRQNRHGRL